MVGTSYAIPEFREATEAVCIMKSGIPLQTATGFL